MPILKVQFREGDQTLLDTEIQTELTLQELLALLPTLTHRPKRAKSSGRYGPLTRHFQKQKGSTLTLKFSEMEGVLGFSLPPSARNHRAWWGNHASGHAQANGWLGAGWLVEKVNLETEEITFHREELP